MRPLSVLLGLCAITATTATQSSSLPKRGINSHAPRQLCLVPASGSNTTDDAPAIRAAFTTCGHGGTVRFSNTTYHINSILNITDLSDCQVDLQGTLLYSTDIPYWLNHSMPIGYQNQSTAFLFGGRNVVLDGHGTGTINGNGNVWYSFIHGQSNYPGRPHALTFSHLRDSVVRGVRIERSQMWAVSIVNSTNDLFEDIYINNTDSSGGFSSNTDGADTMFSSHIDLDRWTVVNGDDSISFKANSTDISLTNSKFYSGLGVAVGSTGQYEGRFETIERIKVDNIEYSGTKYAVYFKTWTGDVVNYPPNGGGGGLGCEYSKTKGLF